MADGLTPPLFHGQSDNSTQWLAQFNAYCDWKNITAARRKGAFYLCLKGSAVDWYDSLSDDRKDSWPHLEAAFKERYGPGPESLWSREKAFFAATQESSQSPLDFVDAMDARGKELGLDKSLVMRAVIAGLDKPTRDYILTNNPATLEDAKRLLTIINATGGPATDTNGVEQIVAAVMHQLTPKLAELTAQVSAVRADALPPAPKPQHDNYHWNSPEGQMPHRYLHSNRSSQRHYRGQSSNQYEHCQGCGGECQVRSACPANGIRCHFCGKPNHFARVCRAARRVPRTQ